MDQESKNPAAKNMEPKRQRFSNDYIASCALFLIDGKPYTGAHFFLLNQINRIRNKEDVKKPLTYSELAEWTYKLVKLYEENGGM